MNHRDKRSRRPWPRKVESESRTDSGASLPLHLVEPATGDGQRQLDLAVRSTKDSQVRSGTDTQETSAFTHTEQTRRILGCHSYGITKGRTRIAH